MKRRKALAIWATISPLPWMVLVFAACGYKINNLTVAIIIAIFTVFSVLGSSVAAIEFMRGEHFFKTQDQLDKEIEEYVRIRAKYKKLIEQPLKT